MKKFALYNNEASFVVDGAPVELATVLEFENADAMSEVVDNFATAYGYQEFVMDPFGVISQNPVNKLQFYQTKLLDYVRQVGEMAAQRKASLAHLVEYPTQPGRE